MSAAGSVDGRVAVSVTWVSSWRVWASGAHPVTVSPGPTGDANPRRTADELRRLPCARARRPALLSTCTSAPRRRAPPTCRTFCGATGDGWPSRAWTSRARPGRPLPCGARPARDPVRRPRQPRRARRLGRGSSTRARAASGRGRDQPRDVRRRAAPSRSPRRSRPGAGAEMHVVYGARDLARQLPAVWQESPEEPARRAASRPVPRSASLLGDAAADRRFLACQDAVACSLGGPPTCRPTASRRHAAASRRGVARGDVLWRPVLPGARASTLRASTSTSRGPTPRSALPSAEVLRRLNQALPDDLDWPAYERLVKRRFNDVANAGTVGHRTRDPAPASRRGARHGPSSRSRGSPDGRLRHRRRPRRPPAARDGVRPGRRRDAAKVTRRGGEAARGRARGHRAPRLRRSPGPHVDGPHPGTTTGSGVTDRGSCRDGSGRSASSSTSARRRPGRRTCRTCCCRTSDAGRGRRPLPVRRPRPVVPFDAGLPRRRLGTQRASGVRGRVGAGRRPRAGLGRRHSHHLQRAARRCDTRADRERAGRRRSRPRSTSSSPPATSLASSCRTGRSTSSTSTR